MLMKFKIAFFIQLLVLSTLACAPRFLSEGEAQKDPAWTGDVWSTRDGHEVATRSWSHENPSAVIIGVHGINDYSNAFSESAPWFNERGVAFYAYDQRGFGKTPQRGAWYDTAVKARDLNAFFDLVAERHPDTPVYIMGLSMGSAVTLATVVQDKAASRADGLILVAPAVWGWQTLNPLYKATLWIGAHTFPRKTLTGSRLEIWPSDNIEMLRAFSRDPLVIKETRIETIYGLVSLMDAGYAAAGEVAKPALVLYGAQDQVVPKKPVFDLMENLAGPKRAVIYEKGFHMLTRDLQRERVWQDIAQWIDDRTAPLPSGEEIAIGDDEKLADLRN